jgi:hypothetical protein
MSSDSPNQNADATRKLFTYLDRIIVPDRGTVSLTITVDSATPGYAFTVSDADGNLLGDGVITNLSFDIESFHINEQPSTPDKPGQ